MKATGIIRRIDDLGRIAVPKEIRRTLRIREGDPLEIFIEDEKIIFMKYSLVRSVGTFAGYLCESTMKSFGHMIAVTDCDNVIKLTGNSNSRFENTRISEELSEIISDHKVYGHISGEETLYLDIDHKIPAYGVVPIIVDGAVYGSVVAITAAKDEEGQDLQYKMLKQISTFLENYLSV